MPIPRRRRYRWPSTSRCATGASAADSMFCCSVSAADSPGDRSCYDGETMKLAMVFPGQGSQSVGMMSRYGRYPAVRETFAEASAVLGQDLWALVEDGDGEALSQTVNTQPVMLAADIAVWRAWRAAGGAAPSVLAGHSLGEYAALVAAGAFSRPGHAGGGTRRRRRHGGHHRPGGRRRCRCLPRNRSGTGGRAGE